MRSFIEPTHSRARTGARHPRIKQPILTAKSTLRAGSRRSSLPMAPYMRSRLNRSEPRNLFSALYLRKQVCSIQWLQEAFTEK